MSEKLAFLFPGQGSHKTGMGQELYENYSQARRIFSQADEILGFELSDLCFKGPEEELRKTHNAQPAILTVSVAALTVLQNYGVTPDASAGHSLGEFSALVASGVLTFEQAVKLVRVRGELMDQAVPDNKGAMAAVMGLKPDEIEEVCSEVEEIVQVANFNSQKQTVISGSREGVKIAQDTLKEKGAQKVIPLRVSGPFHSSLMENAGYEFASYLEKVEFRKPRCDFYSNVTGEKVTDPEKIKELLTEQIYSPVHWQRIMEKLVQEDYDEILILGEGKALGSFLRSVDRKKRPHLCADHQGINKTLGKLGINEFSFK